jgi:hypothetical protein
MAHLADGHRQMRGLAMAVAGFVLDLADRRQVANLVGDEVFGGVDGRDAGGFQSRRLVDAVQPGMGVRGADEQDSKRAGRRGVVTGAFMRSGIPAFAGIP